MIRIPDRLAGIDIDQDCHWSLFSLRCPQLCSLRVGSNTRATWRFKALMKPMRANMVEPLRHQEHNRQVIPAAEGSAPPGRRQDIVVCRVRFRQQFFRFWR
jgi:hypothetical protein